MNLCPKCDHSPLPFLMALVIAGVCAFVTWLTLGLSTTDAAPGAAGGVLAFIVVGATLLHYPLSCLKRHCRHREDSAGPRAQLRLPGQPGEGEPTARLGDLGAAA